MSIRTSFKVLLIVSVACLVACHGMIVALLWLPTLQQIEEWRHGATTSATNNLTENRIRNMLATARDYANWDELYDLAAGATHATPEILLHLGLTPDLADRLNVDIIFLLGVDRTVLFSSQAVTLDLHEDNLSSLISHVMLDDPLEQAGLHRVPPEKMFYWIAAPVLSKTKGQTSTSRVILGLDMNRFLTQEAKLSPAPSNSSSIASNTNYYRLAAPDESVTIIPPDEATMQQSGTLLPTFSSPEKPHRLHLYTQQQVKNAFVSVFPYSFLATLMSWVILACALYLFVDRKLLRKFEALTNEAKLLSNSDPLENVRFNEYGDNEIGDLSRAFINLLERYVDANDSLRMTLDDNRRNLSNFQSLYADSQAKMLILKDTRILHFNNAVRSSFTSEQRLHLVEQLSTMEQERAVHTTSARLQEVLIEDSVSGVPSVYAVRSCEIFWDRIPCTLVELTDITAIRHHHDKSAASNRLQLLGQFSSGISHDLNNILHGIEAYTELLRETPGLTVEHNAKLDSLDEMTARGRALVSQIRGFARSGRDDRTLTNIASAVESSIKFTRLLIPSRVNIKYVSTLHAARWWHGSADDITHIMMNLLLNASEGMGKCGTIHINMTDSQPEGLPEQVCSTPACHVRLEISNIPPAMNDEEADPFLGRNHTTEANNSYNIGLPTVKDLLASYGATLHTGLEGGASFIILLPVEEISVEMSTRQN